MPFPEGRRVPRERRLGRKGLLSTTSPIADHGDSVALNFVGPGHGCPGAPGLGWARGGSGTSLHSSAGGLRRVEWIGKWSPLPEVRRVPDPSSTELRARRVARSHAIISRASATARFPRAAATSATSGGAAAPEERTIGGVGVSGLPEEKDLALAGLGIAALGHVPT